MYCLANFHGIFSQEKIELLHTYTGALGQIDEHLMHWPTNMIHRVKQRLTRLHQYLIRMKKLLAKPSVKVTQVKKKYLARENAREQKALVAARLDIAIKRELLQRLKNRTYGDLYNVKENVFNELMDTEGTDEVQFVEADADLDEQLEAEAEGDFEDFEEFIGAGLENAEAEMDSGDIEEDIGALKGQLLKTITKRKSADKKEPTPKKTRPNPAAKIEIEYENEPQTTTA